MSRVLCVDDSRHIRKMIQNLLPEDFEFHGAANGQEALDFMQTMSFDVVLLDMVMPVMDGLETLAALKERNNETPVLLFTSLSDQRKLAQAQDLGITDFVIKPSDLEFIKEKIIYVATHQAATAEIDEGMGENEAERCEDKTTVAPPPRVTAAATPPVRRLRVQDFGAEEEDTPKSNTRLTVSAALDDTVDEDEDVTGPFGLFVVQQISLPARIFAITTETVKIGRSKSCELILGDESVSREHCLLKRRRGRFLLSDTESSNGTSVNGQPINDQVLDHDDQIRIGRFFLTLKIAGVDTPSDSESYEGFKKHKGKAKGPDNDTKLMQATAVDSVMAEFALANHMKLVHLSRENESYPVHPEKFELGSKAMPCRDLGGATGVFIEYKDGSHWLIRRRLKSQPVSVNDKDTRKHKLQPGDIISLGRVSFAYQYHGPS